MEGQFIIHFTPGDDVSWRDKWHHVWRIVCVIMNSCVRFECCGCSPKFFPQMLQLQSVKLKTFSLLNRWQQKYLNRALASLSHTFQCTVNSMFRDHLAFLGLHNHRHLQLAWTARVFQQAVKPLNTLGTAALEHVMNPAVSLILAQWLQGPQSLSISSKQCQSEQLAF